MCLQLLTMAKGHVTKLKQRETNSPIMGEAVVWKVRLGTLASRSELETEDKNQSV